MRGGDKEFSKLDTLPKNEFAAGSLGLRLCPRMTASLSVPRDQIVGLLLDNSLDVEKM